MARRAHITALAERSKIIAAAEPLRARSPPTCADGADVPSAAATPFRPFRARDGATCRAILKKLRTASLPFGRELGLESLVLDRLSGGQLASAAWRSAVAASPRRQGDSTS